jgi:tricorn protease
MSPDGSRIAFASDRGDGNLDLYVMKADGSDATRLTNNEVYDSPSDWSPDGTRIPSPLTRSEAVDANATNRPSALIEGSSLPPFGS